MRDKEEPLDRYLVREKIEALENLPTLPQVAGRILQSATEEEPDLQRIFFIISSDPSLAAGLLKRANERGEEEILTVERAAEVLGESALREYLLATRAFTQELNRQAPGGTARARQDLWLHSLAAACACRWIAEKTKRLPAAEAELAGLLHDIGKIALQSAFEREYARVIGLAMTETLCLVDAERKVFGIDHTHTGKWLATRWHFPEPLIATVWLHEQSPQGLFLPQESLELVRHVHLANIICSQGRLGLSGPPPSLRTVQEACADLGLAPQDYRSIAARLAGEIASRSGALGLRVEEKGLYYEALQRAQMEQAHTIENLYSQRSVIQRHLNNLSALHDLNKELHLGMTVSEVLEKVVTHVGKTLSVDQTICYLTDVHQNFLLGKIFDLTKNRIRDLGALLPEKEGAQPDSAVLKMLLETGGEPTSSLTPARGPVAMIPLPLRKPLAGALVLDDRKGKSGRILKTEEVLAFVSAVGQALDRAWMEKQLERLSEELAQGKEEIERTSAGLLDARKQAALGRMAAGAAHEINTPLAVISGRAQLLFSSESSSARKKSLRLIQSQCEKISSMIRDLLLVAKPHAPSVTSQKPEPMLREVARAFAKDLRRKKARVLLRMEKGVPPVACDREQMLEVLKQLLRNALEAIPIGGEVLMSAREEPRTASVILEVQDNGPGIPLEDLDKVFDPFYSSREAGRGVGLGLAIAKSIALAHRGTIEVLPAYPKGTLVRLTLSAWKEGVVSGDELRVPVLGWTRKERLGRILSLALKEEGIPCAIYPRSADFLEALRRGAPKLVFVDPGRVTAKSLIELAAWRKEFPDATFVVALTRSGRRHRAKLEALGMHWATSAPAQRLARRLLELILRLLKDQTKR